MSSTITKKTAEELFREAFERLKKNKPNVVPTDTPLTQNNVAKEAGRDPSALKKDRYPILVLEIQAYIASNLEKKSSEKRTSDNRSRNAKQKMKDYKAQVSTLSSIVAAQNEYIEELHDKIDELKAGKVIRM